MRKFQKAAVVVAILGTMGFAGAGTAFAGEGGYDGGSSFDVHQSTECKSHDLNLDVLGEVGVLNGALAGLLGGEGNPGAQATSQGSSISCGNSAFSG